MRASELERFRLRFVERFQQLSGPATAKGVEDTAFYAYAPLLSRNEVGGGPEASLSDAKPEFHQANALAARRWPGGMLVVTTHDTKRTADVRARLDVLSEIPEEWAERVHSGGASMCRSSDTLRGRRVPEPATVIHILQAMVGIWPLDAARCRRSGCAAGAARRVHAESGARGKGAHDLDRSGRGVRARAARATSRRCWHPHRSPRFLDDFERFVARVAHAGLWNALASHRAAPGVARGTRTSTRATSSGTSRWWTRTTGVRWISTLRRAAARRGRARNIGWRRRAERYLRDLVAAPDDGRLKLHVLRAALAARRERPAPFGSPHLRRRWRPPGRAAEPRGRLRPGGRRAPG